MLRVRRSYWFREKSRNKSHSTAGLPLTSQEDKAGCVFKHTQRAVYAATPRSSTCDAALRSGPEAWSKWLVTGSSCLGEEEEIQNSSEAPKFSHAINTVNHVRSGNLGETADSRKRHAEP